ncbi:hypothetical protein D9M68_870250 [compost metagenome]
MLAASELQKPTVCLPVTVNVRAGSNANDLRMQYLQDRVFFDWIRTNLPADIHFEDDIRRFENQAWQVG